MIWINLLRSLGRHACRLWRSVGPTNAHEVAGATEIPLQRAAEGALDGGADAAGQVDNCCLDNDRFVLLLDAHDAIEWVVAFFGILLMARQTSNLLKLMPREDAVQGDDPGGEIIVDAPTRRTKRLTAVFGGRRPSFNGLETGERWPRTRWKQLI
jgi:hypothetical protein